MMKIRWATAAIAAALLAGCAPKPEPKPTPPPPPPAPVNGAISLEQARTQLKAANSMTTVGVVTAVHANQNLLAVRELPVEGLTLDDPVSIVHSDAQLSNVAVGVIRNIENGIVIVRFQNNGATPTVGDFAVRAPVPPNTLNRPSAGPTGAMPPADGATPAGTVTIPPAPAETPAPPPNIPAPPAPAETPAPPPPSTAAPKDAAPAENPFGNKPAPAPSDTPAPPPAPGATPPADAPKDAPPPAAGSTPAPSVTETPAPKPADNNGTTTGDANKPDLNK